MVEVDELQTTTHVIRNKRSVSSITRNMRQHRNAETSSKCFSGRGVDPYGTGDTSPPKYLDWGEGHYYECPPQHFWSNISYFLSMQYLVDKLKELLVLTLEVEFSENKKKYIFFQPDVIF